MRTKSFELVLRLNFGDGCGCQSVEINIPVDFKVRRQVCSIDFFIFNMSFLLLVILYTCTQRYMIFHLHDKSMLHDYKALLRSR